MEDGGEPLAPSHICDPGPGVDCTTLDDGSRLLREDTYASGGTDVPASFEERTVTLATPDGWQIDVIARNTTDEKEGDVVADEPVLTLDEMQALATSEVWSGDGQSTGTALQPGDERSQRPPVLAHPVDEAGVDRVVLEAVGAPDEELLVAQQVDARVVGVVAARRGLELVAADLEAVLLRAA